MRSAPGEQETGVPPQDGGACEQWIEQWRQGIDREECLTRIFALSYRRVFVFFARHGHPEEECHDLAQETFFRAFAHLDSFRGEARFTTWLFQIMENVRRNTLRDRTAQKRQGQEVPLEEAGEPGVRPEVVHALEAEEPDPLGRLLAGERSRRLRAAILQLPAQMRRCVELRVEHDLKYRDIADALEVSIDTVKAHLFQARHILRLKLGDLA